MKSSETPTQRDQILGTLSRCQLLGGLNDIERRSLADRSELRAYPSGSVLRSEQKPDSSFFVISSGVLEVFTQTKDGAEIILARRDKSGEYVGNPAARHAEQGQAFASVRTATPTVVVAIPHDVFQQVMSGDARLAARLQTEGRRHAEQVALVQTSPVYRSLAALENQTVCSLGEQFSDGEAVFRQGDVSDRVYVIVRGEAIVTREVDGHTQTLGVLKEGRCFGDIGVMEGAPRRGTVTARGPLRTLSVSAAEFQKVAAVTPELHEYVSSVRRVYTLAGTGMATQFDGKFLSHAAIISHIHLPDGTSLITHDVVDHEIYDGMIRLAPGTAVEKHVYEARGRHLRREIGLVEGRLVHVFVEGPWDELCQVHQALITRAPIDSEKAEHFVRTGQLISEAIPEAPAGPEQILCYCLEVTRGTIEACLAKACKTLREVADETGATTVCGGCSGRVAELVGDVDGVAVRLDKVVEVTPSVRSFRFVPITDGPRKPQPLRASLPGHHVVVAAKIDSYWVARPYTLTSASCEVGYREVTVKREAHGLMSNWLFEQAKEGTELRLSHPQGEHGLDIDVPDPIVCVVAGIGMTPALAAARSVAAAGAKIPVHIDYSARFERELAYRDELERLSAAHSNITVQTRLTAAGQRIGRKDFTTYHARFPRARYFVCGPQGFQSAVRKGLGEAGVPSAAIHLEEFTPIGRDPSKPIAQKPADRAFMRIGIGLFAAYLLQAALLPHWEAVTAWQRLPKVRWTTGFALLSFFAYQWYLPALRILGDTKRAAKQYPWHKYIGAFAPLIFFFHAPRPGYGLLFALASVYLANALVGLLDKTVVQDEKKRERYGRSWLFVHVNLSLMATGLALLHLFTVLAF